MPEPDIERTQAAAADALMARAARSRPLGLFGHDRDLVNRVARWAHRELSTRGPHTDIRETRRGATFEVKVGPPLGEPTHRVQVTLELTGVGDGPLPEEADVDPAFEQALRAAHAAIWVEDDLTGWPEWEAVTGPHTDTATGEVRDTAAIAWPDGDGIAEVHSHCMHGHGTAADLARYLGACSPDAICEVLAELDRLRAEREDWMAVARIGVAPERYVRFSPDFTDPQRRLAAEAAGIDLEKDA